MLEINSWLLFLIFWIAIIFYVWKKSFYTFVNPVFWMGIGFFLLIGLYYTCGFDFDYPVRASGLFYIIGVCFFYFLGFVCNTAPKDMALANPKKNEYYQPLFIFIFPYIMIALLVFVADFAMNNTFGLTTEIHVDSKITTIGVCCKIICFVGIVLWLYNVYCSIKNNQKIKLYAFLSLIIYLLPNVVIAGRQSLLLAVVSTIVVVKIALHSLSEKKYKYTSIYLILSLVLLCSFLAFSVVISVTRIDIANKVPLFQYMYKCVIPEKTLSQLDQTGIFKNLFLEILAYYSHELPNFQVLYDNWDYGLSWGGSQFQFISRKIPESSRFSYEFLWLSLDDLYDYLGSYSHTWRTVAGNCIMDYGKVGGLIYMFVCGYISRFVYRNAIEFHYAIDILLLALVDAGAFFCLQFSPFCEVSWFYPILWIIIGIPILEHLFRKQISS